jgi:hypothetical protein
VGTQAEEFGDPLEGSGGLHHHYSVDGIVHSFLQVGEKCCGSFHSDEIQQLELRGAELGSQLSGPMGEAVERTRKQWSQLAGAFLVLEFVDDGRQRTVELGAR